MFLVQIFSRLFRTVHHFFCSFGAVSCLFSNSLVSFERLAPCSQNSLALLERCAPVFSNSLMPFGRFAPFLKLCSLFRAVCCFFTVPSPVRAACSFLLKFSILFRLVCCSFSISPTVFARFARFSRTLVRFAWFALCSQNLERFAPLSEIPSSLSNGLLRVLKLSSRFRAVCSLFSNSLLSLERFALFSNSLVSFERFVPCSQII